MNPSMNAKSGVTTLTTGISKRAFVRFTVIDPPMTGIAKTV